MVIGQREMQVREIRRRSLEWRKLRRRCCSLWRDVRESVRDRSRSQGRAHPPIPRSVSRSPSRHRGTDCGGRRSRPGGAHSAAPTPEDTRIDPLRDGQWRNGWSASCTSWTTRSSRNGLAQTSSACSFSWASSTAPGPIDRHTEGRFEGASAHLVRAIPARFVLAGPVNRTIFGPDGTMPL